MPRAAMARFNGIFLPPDGTWIQGGSEKESEKEPPGFFFPLVHSSCDISPLKPSSDSPDPKCCFPAPKPAGEQALCTTSHSPAPTSRVSRACSAHATGQSPIEMEVTVIIACMNIWFQGSFGV